MNPNHMITLLVGACLPLAFTGCSALPGAGGKLSGNRAFIQHWPPPADQEGKIRLAVKDNIDMAGIVTTAGSEYLERTGTPAVKDAPCLDVVRKRDDVVIVGKTNLSELAVAPSGFNEYFGTPRNPQNTRLMPGGSSCGSAVAVASGMADVAFGTDTAGSVRIPAACCGVVGLKTTFGLVPIDGIYPISAEYLDTVGPLGRDIAHTALGMDLLQRGFGAKYAAAQARHPAPQGIRVGRLRLHGTDARIEAAIDQALAQAGFEVVELDETFHKAWLQAKEDGNAIAAAGAYTSDRKEFRFKPWVSGRTKTAIMAGNVAYPHRYNAAISRRTKWQQTLNATFAKVDFIILPTLQSTPPPVPLNLKVGILEEVFLHLQNTVPFNYSGNPALAMPVPVKGANVRYTSLQIVGPRLSEADLLAAGRFVEQAVQSGSKPL